MTTSSRNWSKWVFVTLLAFHGLVAISLGLTSHLNFPFALESGFNIPYDASLDMIGVVVGNQLLLMACVIGAGIWWTVQNKSEGYVAGIGIGIYLIAFGVIVFLKLGDTSALYVDSIRGVLTVFFGILAFRQFKT